MSEGILRESRKIKSKVEELQNILASEIKSRHRSEETFVKQIEYLTSQHSQALPNQDDMFSPQILTTRLDKLTDQLRLVEDALDRERASSNSRHQQFVQTLESHKTNSDQMLQKYNQTQTTLESIENILPSLTSMDSSLLEKLKKEENGRNQISQNLSNEIQSLSERLKELEQQSQQKSIEVNSQLRSQHHQILEMAETSNRIEGLVSSTEAMLKKNETKFQSFAERLEIQMNKDKEQNMISMTEIREILSAEITSRRTAVSKLTQQLSLCERQEEERRQHFIQFKDEHEMKMVSLNTSLTKVTESLTEQLLTLQNNFKFALQNLQMKQMKAENFLTEYSLKFQSTESEIERISHVVVTMEGKLIEKIHLCGEEWREKMETEKSVQALSWKRSREKIDLQFEKVWKECLNLVDNTREELIEEIEKNRKEEESSRKILEKRILETGETLRREQEERQQERVRQEEIHCEIQKQFVDKELKTEQLFEKKSQVLGTQLQSLVVSSIESSVESLRKEIEEETQRREKEMTWSFSQLKDGQGRYEKERIELEKRVSGVEKKCLGECQRREEEIQSLEREVRKIERNTQEEFEKREIFLSQSLDDSRSQLIELISSKHDTLEIELQTLRQTQRQIQQEQEQQQQQLLEDKDEDKDKEEDLQKTIQEMIRGMNQEFEMRVQALKDHLVGSRKCIDNIHKVLLENRNFALSSPPPAPVHVPSSPSERQESSVADENDSKAQSNDQLPVSIPPEVIFVMDSLVMDIIEKHDPKPSSSSSSSPSLSSSLENSAPQHSLSKIHKELNNLKSSLKHLGNNWEQEFEILKTKFKNLEKFIETSSAHSSSAAQTQARNHLNLGLQHDKSIKELSQQFQEIQSQVIQQKSMMEQYEESIVHDVMNEMIDTIAQTELISVLDSSFENMKSEFNYKLLNKIQIVTKSLNEIQTQHQVIEEKISKYDMVYVSSRMRDLEKIIHELGYEVEAMKKT
jgi:hypothetical protein